MFAPGTLDHTVYLGAVFDPKIVFATGSKENYQPVDLTGCAAKTVAATKIGVTEPLLNMTTENGQMVLDSQGGIQYLLTDSQTQALLAAGQEFLYYQTYVTFTDAKKRLLVQGKFNLVKGVVGA